MSMDMGLQADSSARALPPTQIRDKLEKIIPYVVALLVFYTVIRGLVGAASHVLGFDEILTQIVASQSGLKGIWDALSKAVDGQPPASYVIVRAVLGWVSNVNFALRLPSILAMPCTIVCVFLFVRKRGGAWAACLCAFLLVTTPLYRYFIDIARPYSMLMACFAFALLCYQRLPAPLWTALLGLSLAMAQSLHHYAVFAMVPFGLSEGIVWLNGRKFRWGVWLALLVGVLPLFLFWPLLSAMKAYFGGHYWTHFGINDLVRVYGGFFWTSTPFGVGIAAVAVAGVIGPRLWERFVDFSRTQASAGDLAEDVLVLGLQAVPVIGFVITRVMHGAMLDRYVLAGVLGILLGLARSFARANEKTLALLSLFVLACAGIGEISFWRTVHSLRPASLATPVEEFVARAGRPDLPVVISNGLKYVSVAYYTTPAWRSRFVFLNDPERGLKYLGTDNVDKVVRNLQRYMSLETKGYSEFTSEHSTFLLYTELEGTAFEWVQQQLSADGASLQTVAIESDKKLYLVRMPERTTPRGLH